MSGRFPQPAFSCSSTLVTQAPDAGFGGAPLSRVRLDELSGRSFERGMVLDCARRDVAIEGDGLKISRRHSGEHERGGSEAETLVITRLSQHDAAGRAQCPQ